MNGFKLVGCYFFKVRQLLRHLAFGECIASYWLYVISSNHCVIITSSFLLICGVDLCDNRGCHPDLVLSRYRLEHTSIDA